MFHYLLAVFYPGHVVTLMNLVFLPSLFDLVKPIAAKLPVVVTFFTFTLENKGLIWCNNIYLFETKVNAYLILCINVRHFILFYFCRVFICLQTFLQAAPECVHHFYFYRI